MAQYIPVHVKKKKKKRNVIVDVCMEGAAEVCEGWSLCVTGKKRRAWARVLLY